MTAVATDGTEREFDMVLYATGRRPNAAGLGLEALGVEFGRNGEIVVDGWSQTAVPSIFAVGDVTRVGGLAEGADGCASGLAASASRRFLLSVFRRSTVG